MKKILTKTPNNNKKGGLSGTAGRDSAAAP
jgi:hypothetical protein